MDYSSLEFDFIGEASRFSDIFLFLGEWDGVRRTFIRLSDYWYGGAICKFPFLLPGTYLFDLFVAKISSNDHFLVRRSTTLNLTTLPRPPMSTSKSTAPQMLKCRLLASQTWLASWIDCMLNQAALVRMIFLTKIAPAPVSHTYANRSVIRQSNPMLL